MSLRWYLLTTSTMVEFLVMCSSGDVIVFSLPRSWSLKKSCWYAGIPISSAIFPILSLMVSLNTSHLQRPKKSFFLSYLCKLTSNILPNVSKKKGFSNLQKRNFKLKLIDEGGVISESPGSIFASTAHFGARISCYLHILFTSRNWQNSHVEALC